MKDRMKFGISSWCYPWSLGVAVGPQPSKKMTALELLGKAVEYKVDLVQIAENLPLEKLKRAELNELKEFAEANGISIEVGTKGIKKAHLLELLEIASYLQSPILRVLPAFFGSSAVMDEVESCIRQVLPYFEKEGITIVLENTEAFKAEDYAGLMRRIDHPYFKMCLDLANAMGIMEGPDYVMQKLAPYIGNFHFKDVKVTRSETVIGFSVFGTPAGQGDLSLPWIIEQLETFGLNPSIIVELWPTFTENIQKTMVLEDDWVRQSVDYLKSVKRSPKINLL
jgi:sugar phosphate isomerase/epimerase